MRLFYSCAPSDEPLRHRLEAHLSSLRRQGLITEWHSGHLAAGAERHEEISRHLAHAELILLLLSADFLVSESCYSVELTQALTRHRSGAARLVPILLSPVDVQDEAISRLTRLPSDGRALTEQLDQEKAWAEIAASLRRLIGELADNKGEPIADLALSPGTETSARERRSRLLLPKLLFGAALIAGIAWLLVPGRLRDHRPAPPASPPPTAGTSTSAAAPPKAPEGAKPAQAKEPEGARSVQRSSADIQVINQGDISAPHGTVQIGVGLPPPAPRKPGKP